MSLIHLRQAEAKGFASACRNLSINASASLRKTLYTAISIDSTNFSGTLMTAFKGMIKAIIFDLDGTLVESRLDFARMRADIACPQDQDILAFISSLKPGEREEAESIVHQHEIIDAKNVSLITGVDTMLAQIAELGLHTAIVTRNSQIATELKLVQTGIEVERVLTRECAPPKPSPEALLQLCDSWQVSPQEAIYIGDFLYDLQAAANANMHACLYVAGKLPEYAEQAGFVCQDYRNFFESLAVYLDGLHQKSNAEK